MADDREPGEVDRFLEARILGLLAERGPGKTICPSEAARAVAGADDWRDLMGPARSAAERLVAAGEIEVTQRGAVVDLASARGPVRLRLATDHGAPPCEPSEPSDRS